MSAPLRIALAQTNLFVGDVAGNTQRVLDVAAQARDRLGADLVLFPELTLSGYPPEDLLFHRGLRRQVTAALERVRTEARDVGVVVGYPEYVEGAIYNSAALLQGGDVVANYRKQELPNYLVFDEKRYFKPGHETRIVEIKGIRVALLICEDIWQPGPARAAREHGAHLLVVINGSPYSLRYQERREGIVRDRVKETGLPVVYLNMLGGQDELVFDGGSFVMDAAGEVVQRAPVFEEKLLLAEIDLIDGKAVPRAGEIAPELSEEASVYNALVLGVRDYVNKHAFRNALIPIITIIAMDIPMLIGGAVVTEQIFQWPGLGQLTIQSIGSRDYPTLMAINFIAAISVLLSNLLADILYSVADPRIKYN